MKLDENILKTCQGLAMNCKCKVLILDVLGEHRVFLVNDVHLKTREADTTKFVMRKTSLLLY